MPALVRVVLVGVLAAAVAGKALEPDSFLSFLSRLGLGSGLARGAFVLILAVEAALAGVLIVHRARATLLLAGVAFAVFSGVLAYAELYVPGGACGCFGGLLPTESGAAALARSLVLSGLAFVGAVWSRPATGVS